MSFSPSNSIEVLWDLTDRIGTLQEPTVVGSGSLPERNLYELACRQTWTRWGCPTRQFKAIADQGRTLSRRPVLILLTRRVGRANPLSMILLLFLLL